MKINQRLKIERQKRNISRKTLCSILFEHIHKSFNIQTITNWENGKSDVDTDVIIFLSNFYTIPISDLANEDVDLEYKNSQNYAKIGRTLTDYLGTPDLTSFLQKYQIVRQHDWVPLPKYDIIMRVYSIYLSSDRTNCIACLEAFRTCESWMSTTAHSAISDLAGVIYDDSAGHISITDPRDPIKSTDSNFIQEIESLRGDLDLFLEYKDGDLDDCLLDPMPQKLNQRLKVLRLKNGLSQEALAENINVSRRTISNWESSDIPPRYNACRLLAKELNVSLDVLLKGDPYFHQPIDSLGNGIAKLTGASTTEEIKNKFYICEKETTLLIPRRCTERFTYLVKQQLTRATTNQDFKKILDYMRSFLFSWYKLNYINTLFSLGASIRCLEALQYLSISSPFLNNFSKTYPNIPGEFYRNALFIGNTIMINEQNNISTSITTVKNSVNHFLNEYNYDLSFSHKNYK